MELYFELTANANLWSCHNFSQYYYIALFKLFVDTSVTPDVEFESFTFIMINLYCDGKICMLLP